MEKYNEVMRISVENGEEKWWITPRQDEGEIEKLRKRVELLEGHLNGAVNIINIINEHKQMRERIVELMAGYQRIGRCKIDAAAWAVISEVCKLDR